MDKERRLEVDNVVIHEDHINIQWHGSIGFGNLDIYYDKENEKYDVTTECLGEEFYKEILKLTSEYLIKNSNIIE